MIGVDVGCLSSGLNSWIFPWMKQSRKMELDGQKLRIFESKDEQTLKLQKQAKFSGLKTKQVARKKLTKKCFQSHRKNDSKKIADHFERKNILKGHKAKWADQEEMQSADNFK